MMERLTGRCKDGFPYVRDDTENGIIGGATTQRRLPELIYRLAAYEDTGLEPEEISGLCSMSERAKKADLLRLEEYQDLGAIDHLRELAQAEKDGRLVVLPFVAMVEQSLQNGKMTKRQDQRFNGRYAVVYVDKKKWGAPLIDICGRHYDRGEAEKRLAELTREEAEAALKKREEADNEAD